MGAANVVQKSKEAQLKAVTKRSGAKGKVKAKLANLFEQTENNTTGWMSSEVQFQEVWFSTLLNSSRPISSAVDVSFSGRTGDSQRHADHTSRGERKAEG